MFLHTLKLLELFSKVEIIPRMIIMKNFKNENFDLFFTGKPLMRENRGVSSDQNDLCNKRRQKIAGQVIRRS